MQPRYHTVRSSDSTTISYTKVGSGPVPIVLVHGALNSGEQWMQVARVLVEHCTCYVMAGGVEVVVAGMKITL